MRKFLENIGKSISGGDYQRDLGTKSFWQATWHVTILLVIEILVVSVVFVYNTLPLALEFINGDKIESIIKENVSPNQEVVLRGGKISTPDNKPVIIPIPKGWDTEQHKNFIVVDTSVVDPITSAKEYDTFVFVSENTLLVRDKGETKSYDLEGSGDYTFNQQSLISEYNKIRPKIVSVSMILAPIFVILLIILSVLSYWTFGLVAALIVILISRLKRVKISYKNAYIISMYAFTLPILIDTVTDIFGHNLGALWTLLLVVPLTYINTKGTQNTNDTTK